MIIDRLVKSGYPWEESGVVFLDLFQNILDIARVLNQHQAGSQTNAYAHRNHHTIDME
jgi:hypothetical protein